MTNELAKPGANITLLAQRPAEMEAAQNNLIQWAAGKIEATQIELAEAEKNYEIARKNKWRSSPFARIVSTAKRKIGFYEKVRQALEAGYYIVPPFPVDLFAIRTDKTYPDRKSSTRQYEDRSQNAKRLPQGKGCYVSPVPEVWGTEFEDTDSDGKQIVKTDWRATTFQDVGFPFSLVKPAVLERVGKVMKEKLFDQLGALPAFAKADPVVVGQILHWHPSRPPVTFFVSWWLDTADL